MVVSHLLGIADPALHFIHDQAAGLVEAWCRFPVQVTGADVMRAALATRDRLGI